MGAQALLQPQIPHCGRAADPNRYAVHRLIQIRSRFRAGGKRMDCISPGKQVLFHHRKIRHGIFRLSVDLKDFPGRLDDLPDLRVRMHRREEHGLKLAGRRIDAPLQQAQIPVLELLQI